LTHWKSSGNLNQQIPAKFGKAQMAHQVGGPLLPTGSRFREKTGDVFAIEFD
jgi:hypothetical protein